MGARDNIEEFCDCLGHWTKDYFGSCLDESKYSIETGCDEGSKSFKKHIYWPAMTGQWTGFS